MSETILGSITSEYPTAAPTFTAQSEARDPVAEDNTLAEGRDANKWSAEVTAIAGTLGTGGRGEVYNPASGPDTVDVADLRYVYSGVQVSYAGTTGLALTATAVNYVYIDAADNTAKKAAAWPTTSHVRLASVDTNTNPPTVVDLRSHDLRVTGEGNSFKRTATAIDYLATDNDYLISVTDTTLARIITLPTAVGRGGKVFVIKNETIGLGVTVTPDGVETIDGDATFPLLDYGICRIYSDGANWFVW